MVSLKPGQPLGVRGVQPALNFDVAGVCENFNMIIEVQAALGPLNEQIGRTFSDLAKSFVPVLEQMLRNRLEFEKLLDHGQLSAFFAPPAYTVLERPPEPSEKPRQPSRIGFR